MSRLDHYSAGGSREQHKVLIGELVVECNKDEAANDYVRYVSVLLQQIKKRFRRLTVQFLIFSKRGFRYMLRRLDLHFTDKTFKQVMNFIDRDQKLVRISLNSIVEVSNARLSLSVSLSVSLSLSFSPLFIISLHAAMNCQWMSCTVLCIPRRHSRKRSWAGTGRCP